MVQYGICTGNVGMWRALNCGDLLVYAYPLGIQLYLTIIRLEHRAMEFSTSEILALIDRVP